MRPVGAAALALLLVACAQGGDPISGDARNVGGVTMTFRIDPAVVKRGRSVQLSLNLKNNTGTDETLRFPSTQKYDFWVERDGEEVWRWSDGMVFAQVLTRDRIPGQGGLSFTESWEATEVGEFAAFAEFLADGYRGELEGEIEVR